MNCFPKANGTRDLGCRRALTFVMEILILRVHTIRETSAWSTPASYRKCSIRIEAWKGPKGEIDERRTSAGRHPQGRIHSDIRCQARTVGRQRPPLCRLGNLPPQGIAR